MVAPMSPYVPNVRFCGEGIAAAALQSVLSFAGRISRQILALKRSAALSSSMTQNAGPKL